MNLHTYFGLCADHDWDYQFTNSPDRYKSGVQESVKLMEKYRESDTFDGYREIYDDWYQYHLDNEKMPDFSDFCDIDHTLPIDKYH